jgi:hypothetical protein
MLFASNSSTRAFCTTALKKSTPRFIMRYDNDYESHFILGGAGAGTAAGLVCGTLADGADADLIDSVRNGTAGAFIGGVAGTCLGMFTYWCWPFAIVPIISLGLGIVHRVAKGNHFDFNQHNR